MNKEKKTTAEKIIIWVCGIFLGLFSLGFINSVVNTNSNEQNTETKTQDTQKEDTSQDSQDTQKDENATLNKPFKWYDWEITIGDKKVIKQEYTDETMTTYQVSIKKITDGSSMFGDSFKGISKDGEVISQTYALKGENLQTSTVGNRINKGEKVSGLIAFKGNNVDKITLFNAFDEDATIDIK